LKVSVAERFKKMTWINFDHFLKKSEKREEKSILNEKRDLVKAKK